ncbi:ABC transporter permease [Paenibacillus methanolicus]|uniref:Putative ABC transport system permease protein n=1 Tax=Paenibacillus methanolicus TaxID=582686 RepID=A0A5S5BRK7_9BACL|nr:ABC transporter permease [Paenibacillus methanolicus]TYP69709.1 putative ABC transport system permease protein [Paenibacillus methanolicus]
MSLLDLTLRNVQRNFRLYTIYLVSMIIGVVIHFTFSSLMFNEDILGALENRDNFRLGVSVASVVVFLFIIFFILYANSFFMRQRKKEFGTYLLFGMREGQITRMVFYETLALGAVSLVCGILLGGLLSKLFGMLLMKLMQYDSVISLSFPIEAIGTTVAVLLALAVIVTLQSHFVIRRVQLIELFRAKERMEKPIRANRWLALLAVILIAAAFIVIGGGATSVMWQDYPLPSMLIITVGMIGGTFLFFRQFTGWLLQFISNRRRYFEGGTMLWTSALRFQVRGNTLNLTFITLFGTLIMLLTCFVTINYKVQFDAVGMNLPNDIAYEAKDPAVRAEAEAIINESAHGITWQRSLEALAAEPSTPLDETFENPEYFFPQVLLIAQQAYNDIVELRGDDQTVELHGDEAVSLSQGTDFATTFGAGDARRLELALGSGTIAFNVIEKKDYALLGWASDPVLSMVKKPPVLVVADETYASLRVDAARRTYEIYEIEDEKNAEALSKELHALVTKQPEAYYSAFADVYSKQIESSALLLFASAFLAVIAVFALASVIYFKQLREATEARGPYAILRKIGVREDHIRRAVRKQQLFVFGPPLVLGIGFSWFIIKAYILDAVQDFPGLTSAVWAIMGGYFILYFVFYLSSVNLYYRLASARG